MGGQQSKKQEAVLSSCRNALVNFDCSGAFSFVTSPKNPLVAMCPLSGDRVSFAYPSPGKCTAVQAAAPRLGVVVSDSADRPPSPPYCLSRA